jgi:hypothetical protein
MEYLMSYSSDAIGSVEAMVEKFGFRAAEPTAEVVQYRMDLLTEEFQETVGAHQVDDPEGVVDGHVDLIVIALGNLSIFGVDPREAFDRVMSANMAKERGKRKDTDPEGSSIVKPSGWVAPDHSDNHGVLDKIYDR